MIVHSGSWHFCTFLLPSWNIFPFFVCHPQLIHLIHDLSLSPDVSFPILLLETVHGKREKGLLGTFLLSMHSSGYRASKCTPCCTVKYFRGTRGETAFYIKGFSHYFPLSNRYILIYPQCLSLIAFWYVFKVKDLFSSPHLRPSFNLS